MEVKFKDLSGWLKTAIITSYATLIFYALAFLGGFFGSLYY